MIIRALFIAVLFICTAAPAVAAYDFKIGPTVPGYVGRVNGSEVGTSVSASTRTVDWLGFSYMGMLGNPSECSAVAAANGVPDTQPVWCVQEDIPNQSFNNCVYTCQGGSGGSQGQGGSSSSSTGQITTYVYTAEPVITTVGLGDTSTGNDCGDSAINGSACVVWGTGYGEPIPTATLVAIPATISSGESATLNAYCSNAETATIDQGVGDVALTTLLGAQFGSVSVSPSITTLYTLTCQGAGGGANATASVLIGSGTDIIPVSIVPSSGVRDVPVSFTATVQNIGALGTSPFYSELYICPQGNTACQTSGGSHASSVNLRLSSVALNPNSAGTQTAARTFSSAGTYVMRVCADNDGAWNGSVTETNENNNCSAWTTLTITENAGTVSCSVSDTSVAVGETVIYTASPSGGAGAPYAWTDTPDEGDSLGSGTVVHRTYDLPGTYAMQVSATGAASTGFCANVVVGDVAETCPGTPTPTLTASPTRTQQGGTVTLTWSGTNVEGSCTITGPGVSQTVSAAACTVPAQSTSVVVGAQSVYQVTCDSETTSKVINVIPIVEEF
ncbi:hypothetical protein KKH15_01830 [Patescibacteria group bacterium]|nr:hypothetical protein [Patescibacteria group bacterium]MBU1754787.1 hypothetical protein [Patescibacteria group bacterium]